jgi:uncharacterized membrane protein YqaE (UPF0057 family)
LIFLLSIVLIANANRPHQNPALRHINQRSQPLKQAQENATHIINMPSSTSDICLYILALFLPPVPVFIKTGCNSGFLINIGLSILGWIPGVIHAW